uniref:Uncharacterized protein n=1 Tax=Wuchereria bancrofti TaxID=6293 RepID=A0A1I8EFF1_WUCBA
MMCINTVIVRKHFHNGFNGGLLTEGNMSRMESARYIGLYPNSVRDLVGLVYRYSVCLFCISEKKTNSRGYKPHCEIAEMEMITIDKDIFLILGWRLTDYSGWNNSRKIKR